MRKSKRSKVPFNQTDQKIYERSLWCLKESKGNQRGLMWGSTYCVETVYLWPVRLEPPSRRQPQLLINQKMQLIIDLFLLFSIKLVRKRIGVVLCILLRLIKQLFKSVWEKKKITKINASKSFYMKPQNISKWNENSHNRNSMRPLWQLLKGIHYTQMTCLLYCCHFCVFW